MRRGYRCAAGSISLHAEAVAQAALWPRSLLAARGGIIMVNSDSSWANTTPAEWLADIMAFHEVRPLWFAV